MNLQHRNTAVIWSRELGPGVMLTVIPNTEHCPVTLPASLGGRSVSRKGNLVFILAKLLKWWGKRYFNVHFARCLLLWVARQV